MATTLEDLVKRAMELPTEQRARLADELVESLDKDALTTIDKQWIAQAKRRREEVCGGYAQTIPGPEALLQVRDAIRR